MRDHEDVHCKFCGSLIFEVPDVRGNKMALDARSPVFVIGSKNDDQDFIALQAAGYVLHIDVCRNRLNEKISRDHLDQLKPGVH